jgi:uncharacterized DUF497 family protein
MKFEYDETKSQSNKIKHGIDFKQAQALWLDEHLFVVPATTEQEPRYVAFGVINGKHWTGVFTHRGRSIRIISVRRSRDNEVKVYENNIGQ